jgi:hypothetical protein
MAEMVESKVNGYSVLLKIYVFRIGFAENMKY